jgi:hypothetical protein
MKRELNPEPGMCDRNQLSGSEEIEKSKKSVGEIGEEIGRKSGTREIGGNRGLVQFSVHNPHCSTWMLRRDPSPQHPGRTVLETPPFS